MFSLVRRPTMRTTSCRDALRSELVFADAAVTRIPSGDHVYMGGNAATPRVLADAIAARAPTLQDVVVAHVLSLEDDPFKDVRAHLRHRALFAGPADREAVAACRADDVHCHLSEIPSLLRNGTFPVDAALLMVSPPDAHGVMSLGVEVLASRAAAKTVILQVKRHMPRVHGNTWIHVSEADALVEADAPLAEALPEAPIAVAQAIEGHILPLIPPDATLQIGIGGIPNAVVGLLRDLHDEVHDNPQVEALPCDETNDILVAARNDRLVALTSAISVDLTGQVNADSIGTRVHSGVGGQVRFIRVAWRSKGGVPLIALPATAGGGRHSHIVPCGRRHHRHKLRGRPLGRDRVRRRASS